MADNYNGWVPGRTGGCGGFPDPTYDYASTTIPNNMATARYWGERLMVTNGVYRSAIRRTLSYFLTDVEAVDGDIGEDEKKKHLDFHNKIFKIRGRVRLSAEDKEAYGNSFTSLLMPFDRHLRCPNCSAQYPIKEVMDKKRFKFSFSHGEFHAKCPGTKEGQPCGYQGEFTRKDFRSTDQRRVVFKRWNPHQMDIEYNEVTGAKVFIWKMPTRLKRKINDGHKQLLATTPWKIIEAAVKNQDVRFADDFVYHWSSESLAGLDMGGWGLADALINLRQAFLSQVLNRQNETIAMDYVVPRRFISPAPRAGSATEAGDTMLGVNAGKFMFYVRQALRNARRDGSDWQTVPMPLEAQLLGGEAKNFAPVDLLDQSDAKLLNNIGVPAELYRGTLTAEAMPAALRLFESYWTDLVTGMNELLQFIEDRVCEHFGWEPIELRFASVKMIDNIQDQQAILQLAAGHQTSMESALKRIGLDYREEIRKMFDEQRYQQELQKRMQIEIQQSDAADELMSASSPNSPQALSQAVAQGQQAQQGGAPQDQAAGNAGGAAPQFQAPATPGMPQSPQEMMAQAQAEAERLLAMTESQRQSEMTMLKRRDSNLHAITKQIIQDYRQQAQQQGGAQMLQQQFGGT